MCRAMIKAVFFDIDGTLISMKTRHMSESTLKALFTMKEKGIRLFIASGRPPVHLSLLCEEFNAFPWDAFLMMNGQYCYKPDGTVYRSEPIRQKTLETLVPWLKSEADFPCTFFELDHSYDIVFNESMYNYLSSLGRLDQMPMPADPLRSLTHATYQISPYIRAERDAEFLSHAPGLKSQRWSPYFSDMIDENGGKPKGMEVTLELFGLNQNECMAFGDGGNDIGMLEYARIGVAMGNAMEGVKEHADHVTSDCEEDGISRACEYFGLI